MAIFGRKKKVQEEVTDQSGPPVAEASSSELPEKDDVLSAEKTGPAGVTGETNDGIPSDDDIVYPTKVKLVLIMVALCCSIFLVALDQTIIATAIPKITDEFNSITDIGWYGSSYLLTSTALLPVFGRIYTIFSVSLPDEIFMVVRKAC